LDIHVLLTSSLKSKGTHLCVTTPPSCYLTDRVTRVADAVGIWYKTNIYFSFVVACNFGLTRYYSTKKTDQPHACRLAWPTVNT